MPELVETPPFVKDDDSICANTKLKLVSEKMIEKTREKLMFFQVLFNNDNSELFALFEELETRNPDYIFPVFRSQNVYVVKIKNRWLLPSDNPLEIRNVYKLNLLFRKFSINNYNGYFIREIPEEAKKEKY